MMLQHYAVHVQCTIYVVSQNQHQEMLLLHLHYYCLLAVKVIQLSLEAVFIWQNIHFQFLSA